MSLFPRFLFRYLSYILQLDPFSIANWPSSSDEMREELDQLIKDEVYETNPLPAFDLDGSIIVPSKYEEKLKGAIVRVTVTLIHQYLRINKTDDFYADIQEITVVKRPLAVMQSPSKRKFEEQLRLAKRKCVAA